MFALVTIFSTVAFVLAARHPFRPGAEIALVLPLTCEAVGILGLAIRRAHLMIDPSGIRWGWRSFGFRVGPSRIRSLKSYRDAVAIEPKRGSMWYLSARDWARFDEVPQAIRKAELDYESVDRRAPLRSRLQSYGVVLDALMALAALTSFLLMLVAFGI